VTAERPAPWADHPENQPPEVDIEQYRVAVLTFTTATSVNVTNTLAGNIWYEAR
jgi:hypothetical protein